MDVAGISKLLNSKKTFGAGLEQFAAATKLVSQEESQKLVQRTLTLLRSRYTSTAFWQTALEIFTRIKAIRASRVLEDAIKECQIFLADTGTSQAGASHSCFEGQLSEEAGQVQEDTAGMNAVLTELVNRIREQNGAANSENIEETQRLLDQNTEQIRVQLEELQAAALAQLDATQEPSKPPPASKKVVRNLRRLVLDKDAISQLDKDACCSVCREELAEGDEVQVMPCSEHHTFHPSCLKPWLQDNNSCPICRHELPTDDMVYETKKEREKQEAEARHGASHAQTHCEFMYI